MSDNKPTNQNEMSNDGTPHGKNGVGGAEAPAEQNKAPKDTKVTSGKGSYGFKDYK